MKKYNLNDLPSAIEGRSVTFPVHSFNAEKLEGEDILIEGQDDSSNLLKEECRVLEAGNNFIKFMVTKDFHAGNFMEIEVSLPDQK